MIKTKGYAVHDAKSPLTLFNFERRDPRPSDVAIEILYSGLCHSDIHQARDEWGGSIYPMVPGHEIVGKVIQVGAAVTKFKVGDIAGVGCLVDSCRTCTDCQAGYEQYCQNGFVGTYNSLEKDGKTPTLGGYAQHIVTDEAFVLKVPSNLNLSKVAPLLCAGITTYSPLKKWNVRAGQKVGVVGLGGLGHMGLKFARSFGAEVTLFTSSKNKETDAKRLGAHHVVVGLNQDNCASLQGTFDYILDTVSAPHDLNLYLNLLKRDGAMTLVGVPPEATPVHAFSLVMKRRSLTGSLIGGLPETQEMLDYCAKYEITSDVEVIPIQDVNKAYERMIKGDVKFRFVIDMKSLS